MMTIGIITNGETVAMKLRNIVQKNAQSQISDSTIHDPSDQRPNQQAHNPQSHSRCGGKSIYAKPQYFQPPRLQSTYFQTSMVVMTIPRPIAKIVPSRKTSGFPQTIFSADPTIVIASTPSPPEQRTLQTWSKRLGSWKQILLFESQHLHRK